MSDLFWENKLRRTSRHVMPRRFHKYLYNTCSTQLRVHRLVLGVSGGWRLSGRLDHHLGLTKARRDHSRAFVCQGFQHTTSSQPLGEMIELLARFLQKVLTMGTTSTEQRKIAIPRRCPLKISSLVGATMASDVLGLGCLPPYLPGSTPQQLGHLFRHLFRWPNCRGVLPSSWAIGLERQVLALVGHLGCTPQPRQARFHNGPEVVVVHYSHRFAPII